MKKLIYTIITFGLCIMSCKGQNERIEIRLMNCIYENYDDHGTEFKKAITDFEQLLIGQKILKDQSGKSYRSILEKIVVDDDFDYNPSESFFDNIREIGLPQNESYKTCQTELRKNANIDLTKETKLNAVLDSLKNTGELTPSQVAIGILSVLNENDFELDYYKMNMFSLFDVISMINADGIKRQLPESKEDIIDYDVTKALNIYLDGESQVFANNQKVTHKELRKTIRDYVSENKSESVISLKNDRQTMYKTYIEIQNIIVGEIRSLREQFSKENYKTELDHLTQEQLAEVKKIYPQNLIE
ncbi:ExbD/TolR family protein [Gelidibacter gilvus]|nr:biopolymer transporter ExbD [Gelidibacter gilvus]